MITSNQLKHRRRRATAFAFIFVLYILVMANFGAFIFGGIWLLILTFLMALTVLFNFPYSKFR